MIKNDILNGNHLEMYQILLNICIQIIWVQIQIFGVPQIRENLKYTSICNFFSTYLVDDMNGHMGHSQQWSNDESELPQPKRTRGHDYYCPIH